MNTLGWWVLGVGGVLAAYGYLVYPGLLLVLAAFRSRRRPPEWTEWPGISITIPAYNEGRSIGRTLENILALDYPGPRQVLVVSDASTDETDDIVRSFSDRGVELLRQPERAGKTAAENAAQHHLKHDIVVNTDASVRVARDALRPLIAVFADPSVGVASGRDVSVADTRSGANAGETGYVGYEMWVRRLETRTGGIVGASGCFYAIHRHLHTTVLPAEMSRDFAATLIAREHGYRSVSVDDAVCYVARTGSLVREYRRKVRTMTRGLETLFYKRRLLNPVRYGMFAWKLLSHKLLRWLMPPGLVLMGIGVMVLAPGARWAQIATAAGLAGAVGAVLGWRRAAAGQPVPRLFGLPTYVGASIMAALVAWGRALRGERNPIWDPTPRPQAAEPAGGPTPRP